MLQWGLLSSQDPLGSGMDPVHWGFGVPFEPHVVSGYPKRAWCRGHSAAPLSQLSWLIGVRGGSLHPECHPEGTGILPKPRGSSACSGDTGTE